MPLRHAFLIALCAGVMCSVTITATTAQNTNRSRPFTPHPATAMERAQLDKDVQVLMSWLEGAWTSAEQVSFQEKAGIDESLRHPLHEDRYVRVDLPALGNHVLYSEKHIEGDVYVQQFWVLEPVYDSRVIRNSIFVPKVRGSLAPNSWKTPEALSKVEVDALRGMVPECATYWQRRDNHFDVEFIDDCRLREIDGEKAYHGARSALTSTTLWMYLFELNGEGKQVGGNRAGIPRVLKKVGAR